MNTLVFSLAWTILMTVGIGYMFVTGTFESEPVLFRVIFALLPLAGVLFVRDSLRKLRRFRSVRTVGDRFLWTGLDGSEQSSTVDPRIAWRKEDRNFSDN